MNERIIWDTLLDYIGNPYGVAGLLGNLYAESKLNPKNLQSACKKKLGHTDESYTSAVDSGKYSAYAFAHDSAGYGLAQWTYWSRKVKLIQFAKASGTSIGDLSMQLKFLWAELQTYGDLSRTLCSATSVRQASDAVLIQYEKPADQSEAVKAKRASYGQGYYDKYSGNGSKVQKEGSERMATNYDKYINSTGTHYISNSGSDENKAYHDGKAGDQTGHEWELKAWYNRPWSVVLRYPNQAVALKIAQLGIDAARSVSADDLLDTAQGGRL